MHPILLLIVLALGLALLGGVGSMAALCWSWRRPESWGSVLLATLSGLLMLPLGLLLGLAEVTNGFPAESRPLVVGWIAGLVLAVSAWAIAVVRSCQSA